MTDYLQGIVSSTLGSVLSNLSQMALADDWEMRVALPRLLTGLGALIKCKRSNHALGNLLMLRFTLDLQRASLVKPLTH